MQFIHIRNLVMQVLELVSFKTKPGITQEQVIELNKEVMTTVEKFDGFLYRSLAYQEQNQTWLDVVYWQDAASAKAAQEKFMQSKSCQQLMAVVDIESTHMQHADILLSSCTESETCG